MGDYCISLLPVRVEQNPVRPHAAAGYNRAFPTATGHHDAMPHSLLLAPTTHNLFSSTVCAEPVAQIRSTLDSTMGAETNLSPPPLEPETLRGEEQDWMLALEEPVSFGRFLSEPLEWGAMAAGYHGSCPIIASS